MQSGKWIKDLAPDTPVEDAAWRVLTIRFDAVRRLVDDVLQDERDADTVHQLRVATRRAGAALRLFRDCVPDKALKKAQSRLKKLRQAAGAVRDGDVQLDRLKQAAKQIDQNDRPAIDLLIGYTLAQLEPANEELSSVAARFSKRFDKASARVIGSIKPSQAGLTLSVQARASVTSQLSKFHRALERDSHELADLHEARIIAKRLRYTIEIVAACYSPELRDQVYPALIALQESLGEINDHDVSARLYRELLDRLPQLLKKRAKPYRPMLERLIQHHEDAITHALPRFDEWRADWPSRRTVLEALLQPEVATEPNEPPPVENVPAPTDQEAANDVLA